MTTVIARRARVRARATTRVARGPAVSPDNAFER
jgi:hypothetical protein